MKSITNRTLYNNQYIFNYFNLHKSNAAQLSIDYLNDPIKTRNLIDNLTLKMIEFRDACDTPYLLASQQIIQSHFNYYFDPNDRENSQIRGPQYNIACNIFSEAVKNNKMVYQKLNLFSGTSFGYSQVATTTSMNFENPISYPPVFDQINKDSFKSGMDVGCGLALSALTGDKINFTGDKLLKQVTTKPIFEAHSQKNVDVYRETSDYVSKQDFKNISAGVLKQKPLGSEICYVGALNDYEREELTRILVARANSEMATNPRLLTHIDPAKNSAQEIMNILNSHEKTGEIDEIKNVLGFPIVITNSVFNKVSNIPKPASTTIFTQNYNNN